MQVQAFATGGFVVHKITGITPSKISAWFDADGRLLSAEFPDLHRGVRTGSATWDAVQRIGLRLAGTHTMATMVADARARLDAVRLDAASAEQAAGVDVLADA